MDFPRGRIDRLASSARPGQRRDGQETFPRIIWEKDGMRVVRLDATGLVMERSHTDSMGNEQWTAVWDPDGICDIAITALFDVLGEER